MNSIRVLAAVAAIAPLFAAADVTYSRVTILDERPSLRGSLYVCNDRNATLWDRKALLDRDKQELDREGAAIAREQARLDGMLHMLDRTNTAAVADYNQRSSEQNRWVEAHNRRVSEMNQAAALLNSDSADLMAYCDRVTVARMR
jgi:hypothetical protein